MKTIKQRGFTLIELMFVVTIIGILAAIAIPSYQDYIMRAKLVEVFELPSTLKTAIAEYYAFYGEMPRDSKALSLDNSNLMRGNIVQGMTVEEGAIHVTVNLMPQNQKTEIVSIRPVVLRRNLADENPSDYIFWLYGNCKMRDSNQLEVLGTNKTTLTQDNWLKCYTGA